MSANCERRLQRRAFIVRASVFDLFFTQDTIPYVLSKTSVMLKKLTHIDQSRIEVAANREGRIQGRTQGGEARGSCPNQGRIKALRGPRPKI